MKHLKITAYFVYNPGQKRPRKAKCAINEAFRPIDISFWTHGVGFMSQTRRTTCWRSTAMTALSIGVAAFHDLSVVIYLAHIASRLNLNKSASVKRNGMRFVLMLLSLFIRVWSYRQRRKCNAALKRVVKVLRRMGSKNKWCSRRRFIFWAALGDSGALLIGVLNVWEWQNRTGFEKAVAAFVYGSCEPPLSNLIFYFVLFMIYWINVIPQIVIYFHFICLILTETTNKFYKRLQRSSTNDYEYLSRLHGELTETISSTNKLTQTPLIMIFVYCITNTFYSAFYILFFNVDNPYELVRRILNVVWNDVFFVLACWSAAMVNSATSSVRDLAHSLPTHGGDCSKKLCLALKSGEFSGFSLLDSIVINNRTVLKAVGSMLTYGMMLATYDASTQREISTPVT